MNDNEVLGDYLDGLLQSAAGSGAVAPGSASARSLPPPSPVSACADASDTPAALIAEMEADPAFAAPAIAESDHADAVADLIAEMEADPAFAVPAIAESDHADAVADLIAEMEADPAFASTLGRHEVAPQMSLPAAAAAPAPAPAPAPCSDTSVSSMRPTLPPHVQALLHQSPSEPTAAAALTSVTDHSSRWLRLHCGGQSYALELLKVQEVVLPTPLLRLRGTSRSMLGIMNLRGQVVPVLDLGLHLGATAVDDSPATRVVVLEENGETMGLRVSAVDDVTSIAAPQIEPPDTTRLCKTSNHFVRGVARLGQQPMILLDAARFLH